MTLGNLCDIFSMFKENDLVYILKAVVMISLAAICIHVITTCHSDTVLLYIYYRCQLVSFPE